MILSVPVTIVRKSTKNVTKSYRVFKPVQITRLKHSSTVIVRDKFFEGKIS